MDVRRDFGVSRRRRTGGRRCAFAGRALGVMLVCLIALGASACGAARSARIVRRPTPSAPAGAARTGTVATAAPSVGPHLLGGPRVPGAGSKFAGYVWSGGVSAIAADWRVPSLAAGSRIGKASTWIGAQAPGFTTGPFIQIGTQEEVRAPVVKGGAGQPYLEAFWSDTAHAFHPQPLFPVHSGDAISASMRLSDHHWTVRIADATSGRRRAVNTAQEDTGAFNLGLWLQEDVTDSRTQKAFPYPALGPTPMSALSVDGAAPRAGASSSTWMQLPGGYLGPTPLRQGAFTVTAQRISAAGLRYLQAAEPQDQASMVYVKQVLSWRPSTSPAVIRAQTYRFAAALSASQRALSARGWPADVAGLVAQIAATDGSQAVVLRRAARAGEMLPTLGAYRQITADSPVGAEGRQIRARLDVEQLSY